MIRRLMQAFSIKKRIHLDYASTTPVSPEVFARMKPYFTENWANASAIYKEGVAMREAIGDARERLAKILHVRSSDIIFTSGGTESNNLAILGTFERLRSEGVAAPDIEMITTQIEHPSVLETMKHLEKLGITIRYVPVDDEGRIDISAFEKLLSPKVRLVSFAYVNSEIGTIQDVKRISRAVRAYNDAHHTDIAVHVDACQAPLWLPCALDQLGVDMMSLDAGKCYGPKGTGVLVKRHRVALKSISFGGGQEQGLRPGTENTALIIGCIEAIIRAQKNWEERSKKVQKIRDHAISQVLNVLPHTVLNGSAAHRVANNINISIPGIDGEYAVITLDAHGVAASTRSACGAGKGQGSHVVRVISSGDESRALSTIRMTLGETTTKKDMDTAIAILKDHIRLMK